MAANKKVKGKHILLRKMKAGIILTCFSVYILGQISKGVSAKSLLLWSSLLLVAIWVVLKVMLRFWTAWEEVSEKQQRKDVK